MFRKKENESGNVMRSDLEREWRKRKAFEMLLFFLLLLFVCAGGVSVGNTVYKIMKDRGLDVSRQSVVLACYTVSFVSLFAAGKNFEFFTGEWKKEAEYWEDRCRRLEAELKEKTPSIPTEDLIFNAAKETESEMKDALSGKTN